MWSISKKITFYIIGAIILISLLGINFVSLFSSNAYAQQAADTRLSLEEKTEIWSFFNAVTMAKGESPCELHTRVSKNDALDGKLLHSQDGKGANRRTANKGVMPVGIHVRETGDDGKLNCHNDDEGRRATNQLIQLLGYGGNIDGFLKEIGYKEDGNNYTISSPDAARTGLNSILAKFGIPSLWGSGQTVAAYKYQILSDAFTVFCKPTHETGPDAKKRADDKTNKWHYARFVDTKTGDISQRIYQIQKNNSDIVAVGQGINAQAAVMGAAKNGYMTCAQMARELNNANLAQAYSNLIKSGERVEGGGIGGVSAAAGGQSGLNDGDGDTGSLECEMSGNPLSWIMCPMINGFNKAIGAIDELIMNLMTISPKNFDTSGNNTTAQAYYKAWSSFRTLALGIVIIAALVVIIGSALGYEILDAYTIRKVLPRVIFAIIFISLSWHILTFLVVLFNDLGNGVRWLIYQPFAEIGTIKMGGSGLGWASLFGGAFVIVGFALWQMAIFTFLGVGLIVLAVAFLILVLRELLVILLVILAPVGIACYIFPNTQKGWQLWQNTLTTMLIVFPILAAVISFGRVFAAVSYAQDDAFRQFLALVAFFIPYFLIPYSFKLAGGAMAGLANIANNSERGVFDRMRNMRQKKAEYNVQRMKDGERFNNKLLNTTTARASTSRFGFTGKGRSAYEQKMALGAMRHAKSDAGQAGQFNDDMLQALTFESANAAREGLVRETKDGGFGMSSEQAESAIAAAKANGGFGKSRQYYAAQQLAATGTGYKDQKQVASTIARVSGGNESVIGALGGNINSQTKQVGRHDLAPGAGALIELSRREAGLSVDKAGNRLTPDYDSAHLSAWGSADIGSMVRNKTVSLEKYTESFSNVIKSPSASAADRRQAAVALAELHAALPSASAENQKRINNALVGGLGISFNSGQSVESQLADMSRDAVTASEINGLARKYGSSTPAGARSGGEAGGGPEK